MLLTMFLFQKWLGDSWCTNSSFSSLLVKLSQVFDSALFWEYSQACRHPCWMCTFSYPISSFQSTLNLISFDTALLEQPALSVMTLCDLPSLWRVSMIVFWTIASQQSSPLLWFQRTRYTLNLCCRDVMKLNVNILDFFTFMSFKF